MKKLALFIVIALSIFQTSNLKSQNNYVKFIALTTIVINQASISYEYALNENQSLGVQATTSFLWMGYPYYSSNKVVAYYRYYSNLKLPKRTTLFGHIEAGYYGLYKYNLSFHQYTFSDNITTGYLIGVRRYYGTSERWFFDFAIGINIGYRMYDSDGHWEVDRDFDVWYFVEYPPEGFTFLPRMIVEVGFKF